MLTLQDLAIVYASAPTSTTTPELGLQRRVLASTDKLMLVEHRMEKGWVGTAHSHPHEQLVYVISGRLRVNVGGRHSEIGAGDSFVVRGGVEHQASAVEESHILDVFTPRREDY